MDVIDGVCIGINGLCAPAHRVSRHGGVKSLWCVGGLDLWLAWLLHWMGELEVGSEIGRAHV